MRSFDYVVKRIAFAFVTIFVAVTLNFVIFRAAPGDATTALRCLSCTDEVRAQVRTGARAGQVHRGSSTRSTSRTSRTVTSGARSRTASPCCPSSWEPLANTMPMLLLGTFFSIVFGLITGVVAAWRRGTLLEKLSVWFGLAFFSLPDAVARDHADPVRRGAARPAHERHQRPVPLVHQPERLGGVHRSPQPHGAAVAHARPRALRRVHADHALGPARDVRRGLRPDSASQGPDDVAGRAQARAAQLAAADHDARLPLARLHRGRLDPRSRPSSATPASGWSPTRACSRRTTRCCRGRS